MKKIREGILYYLRSGIERPVFWGIVFLIIGVFNVNAHSGEVVLSWSANSDPDLKGYKIYYGTSINNYNYSLNVVNATSCVISGLTPGKTYYFAATAYNTIGDESDYSNHVSKYIPSMNTPGSDSGSSTASQILFPDDFTYSDNTFGDSQNGLYASGSIEGDMLKVTLGGVDGRDVLDGISGGWSDAFEMDTNGYATITFSYRLIAERYDSDECTQVLLAVDGSFLGLESEDYVDQICGIGDTDWRRARLEVYLSAGSHSINLGGYNNKKTGPNEIAEILFKDIEIQQ